MRARFGGSYLTLTNTIQSRGGKTKVFKIGFLKSGAAGEPVPPYSYYYNIYRERDVVRVIVIVVDRNTRFFFYFFIMNQKTLSRSRSTRQRTPCAFPSNLYFPHLYHTLW
jgi:hypothetical protein